MTDPNTSSIDPAQLTGALLTDLDPSTFPEGALSHARNAIVTPGNKPFRSNAPSTVPSYQAPYPILKALPLPDGTHLVFSTDNTNSEIGLGDPRNDSYTPLRKAAWNFHQDFPLQAVAKKVFQKGIVVTFTDKRNPVRRVELRKIATIPLDDTLLFRHLKQPVITVKKNSLGNIPNGSYSVAMAYSLDNQIFSDVLSITNRIALFSETGSNSLDIRLDGLDTEFKKFSLIVVCSYIDPVTKGVTKTAKVVGEYATTTTQLSLTDFINTTYTELPLSTLVTKKKTFQKAGLLASNSNYLLLGDLVSRPEEDYQQKALTIKAEYVIKQVPATYYETDGEDVSFYRDENYDFYIQGVYNTGEETDKFQIAGRKPNPADLALAATADTYEHDPQFQDCTPAGTIARWQVENTASTPILLQNAFTCNQRILGYGQMGYHQSTELYPPNLAQWGDSANTPVRLHRFPDESKVPRYTTIAGKTYLNLLGVRFKNIPAFTAPDIVGYKITRSDRKGGNGTVVARGLLTNVRSYTDTQVNQEVLYSAYPVNSLAPDPFLSATQTSFKNNREQNFSPLTTYYQDRFTFYSPHTAFEPRYSLGTEVKIECEEVATVEGQFEKVYNHPKLKLMNQFSFWLSAAVGFIESVITLTGKTDATGSSAVTIGVTAGTTWTFNKDYRIRSVEDLVGLDILGYTTAQIKAGAFDSVIGTITTILTDLAALGLKIPYSVFAGIREADKMMGIIEDFTGNTHYAYQYNAHAAFTQTKPVASGNKRRRLLKPATYLGPVLTTLDDTLYNNFNREKSVYLHLNKALSDPTTKDTSCNTLTGFGGNLQQKTTSTGSAYYATSKAVNPNQYGQPGSAAPVSLHSGTFTTYDQSPVLFGGDCIIARLQVQKRMPFFTQDLANTNYPDGVEYDYRLYRNLAYPRFWLDSTKYDFSELLSKKVVNFTTFSRTTEGKHNLDAQKTVEGKSIARIDDAYMYTSSNCVLDFFVECDYNLHFRERSERPFYGRYNTHLSQVFRSDHLPYPEEFLISRAYSDLYTTEIFNQQQRNDFDPANPLPTDQPNSVIYSLPAFNLQEVDNWQYFLPANYFAFTESDFGSLTAIHKLDQERLLFLFSRSSPYLSMGRDFLELEGSSRKITIGDGGLFAQDPREMMPTDNHYGASTSRYAFSNTHLGRFYPSSYQGRILSFSESLDDITRAGLSQWCKQYMPLFLYQYFPTLPQIENPAFGVGYLSVFDSASETYHLIKRDYSPVKALQKDLAYDAALSRFTYKGKPVSLQDPTYFQDISWNLSYDPAEKKFISWHDWAPDTVIQLDNHFMTTKGNRSYKHYETTASFCNFYGVDYPFEVEFVSASGQNVHTVRSLEYVLEAYHYKNFGRDKFHLLNENFSHLVLRNTEQISPLLHLQLNPLKPLDRLHFPRKNPATPVSFDVLYAKEENKYRVHQFWDAVKDRGEFTSAEVHLFPTDESGYRNLVNPLAIDRDKPETQRKKFRHYFNKVRFIKDVSGQTQLLVKIVDIKKLQSPR